MHPQNTPEFEYIDMRNFTSALDENRILGLPAPATPQRRCKYAILLMGIAIAGISATIVAAVLLIPI